MHVRWIPTIIALIIAFVLLAFVTPVTLFGITCYAVGEFSANALCLKPWIYWGAWLVAAVLLLIGLRAPGGTAAPAAQPEGSPAPANRRKLIFIVVGIAAVAFAVVGLALAAYWYARTKPATPETPVTEQTEQPAPPEITPPAPEQQGRLPVPGQYRWTGQATQNNGATYGVNVIFDATGDADIEWPDLGCRGTLVFMSKVGAGFQYAEQVTGSRCSPRATVTLTPAENGAALEFLEEVGDATVRATMRPF